MAIQFIPIPLSRINDETTKIRYKKLLREIEIVNKLKSCPNTVDVYGFGIHELQIWLCMELMDMSLRDMYSMIQKVEQRSFPEEQIGFITVRIIGALSFCKAKGIMDRDIKPSNILINRR